MDEISVVVSSRSNLSTGEWWIDALEEDATSPLSLDANEGGLWSGNFVPPPPRPIFLDEGATPDGLTTCDLCTWAWQNRNAFTLDAAMAPGEIGWVLTLIIVSLVSAVIGAIVMIIALHCRRIKTDVMIETEDSPTSTNVQQQTLRPPINTPNDKPVTPTFPTTISNSHNSSGVWSWLSKRTTSAPPQLIDPPPTLRTENHYTHMDETYSSGVGEALYAELDRESTLDRDSNSPAYQNSAYTDPDAPPSSAPSSAYYSDLSVTTIPDRAYEVVGLVTMPVWETSNASVGPSGTDNAMRRPVGRLAAISETVTVPSDYV